MRHDKHDKPDITVRLEFVSPEKAARWLKYNTHNRAMNPHRVRGMADGLKRGEWEVTSQGVGFDVNGALADGQHRLTAIVQAGIGMWMVVVRGLAPEAQDVVDTGQARTLGQTLDLHGESHTTRLAVALRFVWSYREYGEPRGGGADSGTKTQLLAVLDSDSGLRESCAVVGKVGQAGVSDGMLAACHYLFGLADEKLAERFFNDLATGEGLTKADPAYLLREVFAKQAATPRDRRLGTRLMALATVKAINAFALGRELRQLKAGSNESFPQIVTAADLDLGSGRR